MVVSLIQSQISATELTVRPGYSDARLTVGVVNTGDRQASFHVLLSATGEEGHPQRRWYRLNPMASTKVPAGTHSDYIVDIFDTPLPGFVGLANVTVRIISPELQSEERHVLRLRVEPGIDTVPFKLELLTQTLQDYPGETIEIPARIHNTSRYPLRLELSCPALASWLVDSSPTHVQLRPNRWHEVTLIGEIPTDLSQSQSRTYPFHVVIRDENGNTVMAEGRVDVLPWGHFEFDVENTKLTIPTPLKLLPDWRNHATHTQLVLENQSNLMDRLQVNAFLHGANHRADEVQNSPPSSKPRRSPFSRWQPRRQRSEENNPLDCQITLTPETFQLSPGQTQSVETTIQAKRPWIGWIRHLLVNVQASLSQPQLDLRHDTKTIEVRVIPIIPCWLQILATMLLAGGLVSLWYAQTYGQHHRQLVSTVQFNGTGTQVISGSSDQTIRRWHVDRGGLSPGGQTIRLDKAVRVLQYRPVDNNQVAVGLENGEIQLWDLLERPDQPLRTLINQTGQTRDLDDRVMALATTADARHLFSGYGSGLVSQWYIGPDRSSRGIAEQPLREQFIPEMAVYDVALVGPSEEGLAIAGRYNKLLLWPWSEDVGDRNDENLLSVQYPPGGQDDYITSLDTAEQTPFRLATADNQGRIMLWDVEECLEQWDDCRVIDQWQPEPDIAIRDVALSADGCHLASVSDDGKVRLWPLTRQGRRQTRHLDGILLKESKTGFNSVDIKLLESNVLIVSGADNKRIGLYRHNNAPLCQ